MTIPHQIKKLTSEELKILRESLGPTIVGFMISCYENSKDNLASREPLGNDLDYYNWGFLQGINKTHKMYKDLVDIIDEELKSRLTLKEESNTIT